MWDSLFWVVSFLRLLWSHWGRGLTAMCATTVCRARVARFTCPENNRNICAAEDPGNKNLIHLNRYYTSECGADPAQEGNMLGALGLVFAENSDFKKKSESVKPQKPHSTTF